MAPEASPGGFPAWSYRVGSGAKGEEGDPMLPTDYQFQPADDRYVSNRRLAAESRQAARRTAFAIVAANVVAIAALILLAV
ncbi:MAG TPA: hypothetical protein VHL52_05100 [Acidimicrobiia bacterium]|nr:hypothetical protein [Acidimicrobiia bacterium]